jgi:hypothetical protein
MQKSFVLITLAAALLAGCGGSAKQEGAAELVPPDAIAFAHGDEQDLALLADGKVVAFAKTRQGAKLQDDFTVQRVDDWFVGASSPEAVAAVRAAASGRSYADVEREPYRPTLLREVPSGALVAYSFKDQKQLGLKGEGILYVTQGFLVPTLVVEAAAENADALRRLGSRLEDRAGGLIDTDVFTRGDRAILTTGSDPPEPPERRLLDDQPFKDAAAAADLPDEVTWLAYADIPRVLPVLRTLDVLDPALVKRLERVRTALAYGTSTGGRLWLDER